MEKPAQHVAVRLEDDVIARVEALIPQLAQPWREATRSDVLRLLIHDGLARLEKDPQLLRRLDGEDGSTT